MNFVVVAIVSAIVLGHPFNKKSRVLIGLNSILLCLNNSSQNAKKCVSLQKSPAADIMS